MSIDTTPEIEKLKQEHGVIYWLFSNIAFHLRTHVLRYPRLYSIVAVLALLLLFIFRPWIQPLFILIRVHTFDILLISTCVFGTKLLSKKLAEKGKRLKRITVFTVFIAVLIVIRVQAFAYFASYARYTRLNEIDLQELPTTAFERVQPVESIRTLADGVMDQNRHPSEPDFVRIGKEYRFTMALEPDAPLSRLVGTIDEIFDIPGSAAAPDFSKDSRHQVKFSVGERMFLGKNSRTCAIKSLPPWRFFSYTPRDVKYFEDEKGEMIQVVSLSRLGGSWWSKWVFPSPEFGGVLVIRQNDGGLGHALWRLFFGEGEWIPPQDITKHEYLRGQNLVPYDSSRYAAQSFRFEKSFWAPFPGGSHNGDTMIPDIPDTKNNMPFTIYCKFGPEGDERNKLYHYFALEPWQKTQHGLSDSLFFPADGIGQPMAYRHYKQDEGMHGVVTVDSQVRGSDIHVDWTNAIPIEHRPWIHDITGKRRLMWLTTVVVFKNNDKRVLTAGSRPNIVLTDARTGRTMWINDVSHPSNWVNEVEKDYLDSQGVGKSNK